MGTDRKDDFGVRQGARTTQRRGRMTAARHTTLADLGPRWMLEPGDAASPEALTRAFGRDAARLLDIGAGNGEAARAWAHAHPDHDVVAVDLHRPGLARLLRDLEDHGPTTLRAVEADALAVLEAAPPETFAVIRVLFPDPWPKRRHVGRRLVDPDFVRLATERLTVGGTLQLATDWSEYAHQMRASLATEARLAPVIDLVDPDPDPELDADPLGGTALRGPAIAAVPRWRSERPERPVTAYERRGLDAGRAIVDLVARRSG